jgi:hypothetical protein
MFIHFIQKGTLVFVLPRSVKECYYKVHQGGIIGLEDYIYNLTQEGEVLREGEQIDLNLFDTDDYGRRRFSVVAEKQGMVHKLNIFEFQKMLIEFPEFVEKLIMQQAG